MSDRSSSDSDVELIDLTDDDNSHPDIDGHFNDAPDQEEIYLGLDIHGESISHIIYRPGGPMDVDNEEESSDEDRHTPEVEGSLFFGDDDDEISNSDGDDSGHRGPPSPPSSDDPGSEFDGPEDTDGSEDYRNRFLHKRNDLRECKRVNRNRVTARNRQIRGLNELVDIMKEAVREFYAANEANIQQNERLVSENHELRRLVPEEELEDFPDPIQLNIGDMEASLPQEMLARLPSNVRRYFRRWRGAPGKARKTELSWPKVYTRWIRHGHHRDYDNWGDIHKLACQEENMPSVFGKSTPLRTHPDLTLCAPPPQQEESVITGEGEVCTPEPYDRRERAQSQEDTGPFNFDILPTKDRQKIITKILRIGNKLQHLQHIELLWMGSQKLTYMIDQKGKYVSRRTHDLAYLPEACRLKTVAIHLPESSREYMRRKHEPPQIVQFLAQKTRSQPNFRRFRALRTLQGVDYLYCLRGIREMAFFDYDESRRQPPKMPVRDWTFVRDINESVRREKSANDEHFSQLRYLAPLLTQPSVELARQLEDIVNPPQRLGLMSPPPDMYPQLQAALDQADTSEDESDGDPSDGDSDEEMGGDTDDDSSDSDDDDGGGTDAHSNCQHLAADDHGRERDESPADLDELAAGLSDILSDVQSDSNSEQEKKEEAWSVNGQTIDLISDDEDGDGPQYGRDRSTSLFVRSPPRANRPVFTTKVETPSPPRATPPALADQAEITPARENRADSSLFVSPTPYEYLNPQAGDRSSPIDLTEGMGVSFSSPTPSSHSGSSSSSSSSSCSSGIKREWGLISVDDDDENDGDDEDEGFQFLGSFPKRPRRPHGGDDDDGAEMMDLEEGPREERQEELQEEFVMA
ncbi:hypothetical protein FPRO06_08338 [Fusarium proliferatum]|nr:hypothetical protein FPRO06_08338 [Fusarium proliferatum]